MARPRSEDKRNAILVAAARVVGERGVGAPTARIARLAGVAEGTLFTYFDNKDALLNQLYLMLKAGMREAMMEGFPRVGTVEQRARHAWSGYVAWGVANPDGHRAMRQLGVSERIDAQHRAAGMEGFGDLSALLQEQVAGSALAPDQALAFIGALFNAMAEATMEFIARHPDRADVYRDAGFQAFWGALSTNRQ